MAKNRSNPQSKPRASIQEKIDAMRQSAEQQPPEAEDETVERGVANSDQDEAFLQRFEEQIKKRAEAQGAPHPVEVAIERNAEYQERLREAEAKGQTIPGQPSEPETPESSAPKRDASKGESSRFPARGTILQLPDGSLAVFHKDVPRKDYQMLYKLEPDGSLQPEGVHLNGYEYRRLGQLPREDFAVLLEDLSWERDHIVFHLDEFKDAKLVPQPEDNGTREPAESSTRDANWPKPRRRRRTEEPPREVHHAPEAIGPAGLHKGERFRISFGKGREWEAVYWDSDQQGSLVAHKTEGNWALMHLDLSRFGDSLEKLGMLDDDARQEVLEDLRRAYGAEGED